MAAEAASPIGIGLLLGMQAAGMVVDWIGAKNQQEFADMGAKVQQAGIEANISQNRLETEDQSLQAMRALRQNIGTQIATYGARGTRPGAGSAVTALTESMSNFNADERTRRLNSMGNENQLRAGAAVSRLKNMSENSKLWSGFASRTFNKFPSSASGWKEAYDATREGFGLTKTG